MFERTLIAAAATITRPANATPYTSGDVIGGVISFPSLALSGGTIIIRSASLRYDVAAIPAGMTTCSLHFYSATPPSALADNAAWDLAAGDRSVYRGSILIPQIVDLVSTLYVRVENLNTFLGLMGTDVFAYLVTTVGFTPAGNSEILTVTVNADPE